MLWYALKHPISIHALREEGDLLASAALSTASNFYPRPPRGGRLSASTAARCLPEFLSTPSARRATILAIGEGITTRISIHALREEGDLQTRRQVQHLRDFYPRPPRGGRLTVQVVCLREIEFLSTPSARRATFKPRFL